MLTPVLVLVVWSLVVWLWMYAKRIPAMQAAKIKPQDAIHAGSLSAYCRLMHGSLLTTTTILWNSRSFFMRWFSIRFSLALPTVSMLLWPGGMLA